MQIIPAGGPAPHGITTFKKRRKLNDEVLYGQDPVVSNTRGAVQSLKKRAAGNRRGTIRLCAHPGVADKLHEMVIVHSKETYIRPHKHPGKSVSYHVVEGKADMVLFDGKGAVVDVTPLDEFGSGKTYFHRIQESYFYTPVVRSDYFVFHEITNGPFKPSDTVYASWAPEEKDASAVDKFRRDLLRAVKNFKKR
ncbi:MAG: WbuC family cupin fold metalloprotein [Elusimicrobiota bacterium]